VHGVPAVAVVTAPSGETLDGFLRALASDAPAPGGGAAAAVTVALAAALVAMVCRVTTRRDPGAPSILAETAEEADGLRGAALELAAADASAYARVLDARRRPHAERAAAEAEALRHATDVPVATARRARDVVSRCVRVAPFARSSTLSDLGVGAALAWAGLEAGAMTARTNLAEAADSEYVGAVLADLAHLVDEGSTLRQRLADTLAERTQGG
jgi:formiminotetrahydrofolate cyclodeaminase